MIRRAPALILMAIIGEPEPGADDAADDVTIVGCGVGAGVTEAVVTGGSGMLYGSCAPDTTNGTAVGKPPGAHAGRRSYARRVAERAPLASGLAHPSEAGVAGVLDIPAPTGELVN